MEMSHATHTATAPGRLRDPRQVRGRGIPSSVPGSGRQGSLLLLACPSRGAGSGWQLPSQGALGMQAAEPPQRPDGEDVAVRGVTDGTRLVEHPCSVLLGDKQRAEWDEWQGTAACSATSWKD